MFKIIWKTIIEKKQINRFGIYYYLNNKRHRIDGPAVEYSYGIKIWYINGQVIGLNTQGFDQEKFEQYKKLICLI